MIANDGEFISIICKSYDEASRVRMQILEALEVSGYVSVADLYKLEGLPPSNHMYDLGWQRLSLRMLRIEEEKFGTESLWYINLPAPTSLVKKNPYERFGNPVLKKGDDFCIVCVNRQYAYALEQELRQLIKKYGYLTKAGVKSLIGSQYSKEDGSVGWVKDFVAILTPPRGKNPLGYFGRYELHLSEPEPLDPKKLYNNYKTKEKEKCMRDAINITKVITHNDKVTIVKFSDGTFTKSICSKNDTFDIDVGITVCLMKKLLKEIGAPDYSVLLRNVHKMMDAQEKDKVEKLEEKRKRREDQKKREEKNKQRRKKELNELGDAIADAIKRSETN